MFEMLEKRCLMAGITVTGTPDADVIAVRINPNNTRMVQVTLNGVDSYYTSVTSITVSGGTGDDDINIWQEVLVATVISGNAGHDTIRGGGGPDQITGNAGNDVIYGGLSSDTINGNDGGDYIDGGDGNDILIGSTGSDDIYAGSDTSDTDAVYQNDSTNADDGYIDELFVVPATTYYKTSRDTLSFY